MVGLLAIAIFYWFILDHHVCSPLPWCGFRQSQSVCQTREPFDFVSTAQRLALRGQAFAAASEYAIIISRVLAFQYIDSCLGRYQNAERV